ncbi:hypothetical protein BDZ91DRAFT_800201 [Kalaharituber pfeilii]|nr:hypothetical protein BDZ91DRAFT_800201 [Kalaharituber pfeilii]
MATAATTPVSKYITSSTPMTAPGPVRNVRSRVIKRRNGYGLFFSDDEDEDGDVSMGNQPQQSQPQPTATRSSISTSTSRTTTKSTITRVNGNGTASGYTFNATRSTLSTPIKVNGNGVKALVFERKDHRDDDLYDVPAPSRKQSSKEASHQSPQSLSRNRAARQSPYGRSTPPIARSAPWKGDSGLGDELDDEYIETPQDAGKYTMRGGLVTPPTKDRDVFSRNSSTPKTPGQKISRSPEGNPTPGGKTTWGEWLKKLIPDSVKKAAVARPLFPSDPAPAAETRNTGTSTPQSEAASPSVSVAEEREEEMELSVPGGFGKEKEDKKKEEYINPLLATQRYNHSPVKGSRPLTKPFSFNDAILAAGKYGVRPSARARLSASFVDINGGRNRTFSTSGSRPRISSVLGQSSVPSSPMGYKRQRTSLHQGPLSEEEKRRIAEERLAELERTERDRRVEIQEIAYERRLLEATLGIKKSEDVEMDAEGSDTDDDSALENMVKKRKDKGKAKEADTQTEPQKSPEKEPQNSPEKAPQVLPSEPHTPPKPVVTEPSSFLFGGGAYKPATAPPPPTMTETAPLALPAPETTENGTPKSFSSDSDKENTANIPHQPPATPTLSHAQLPTPIANTGPAFVPPPSQPLHMSPQKGLFSDPASKARSQAEKFKPAQPSGLRASTIMQSDSPPRAKPVLNGVSPQKKPPAQPQFLSPVQEKQLQQRQLKKPAPPLEGGSAVVKKHVGMVSILSMQVDDGFMFDLQSENIDALWALKIQLKTVDAAMIDAFTKAIEEGNKKSVGKGGVVGSMKVREEVENAWKGYGASGVPGEKELDRIVKMMLEGVRTVCFGPV